MLTLLLADAELERIPQAITGHQQVVTSARHVGTPANRMLLDSSLHYAAMRNLEDANRRGRPDLVHLFLLTALESAVNKAGQLRVLVHTRDGHLIRIDPKTRLVRNYNRFCGLVQQLFETRQVPPETPLLTLQPDRTVKDIVAQCHPTRVLILDESGKATRPWQVFSKADAAQEVVAVIGGFPHGTFRSELPDGERISFGPEQLTVWTVASEILVHYEAAVELPPPSATTSKR